MNPTRKLIYIAPLAVATIAAAAPAVGPWLTYDIVAQQTNWDETAVLPQFDPATLLPGQSLVGLEFILIGFADSTFEYQNTALVPADVTLQLQATLTFGGPLASPVVNLANFTGATVAPGATVADTLHDDDQTAGGLSGLALLPFIGTGTVDIPVTADGGSSVIENVGNGLYTIDTTAGASISIRYLVKDDRGGGEVPESSNWLAAAVFFGALTLGAFSRRIG